MKRLALIFAFITLSAAAFAQIDPTVEVSRSYDVRLQDVEKPENPLTYDDSLNRFDVSFDYSIFNRPYRDLYDFTPYETVQLSTVGRNRTPVFYAKLGAQYPFIPTGEIYLQTKPKNGFCAGLYALHNSFWGETKVGGAQVDMGTGRMNNGIGGAFTYDWSTGSIIFDVKEQYDWYNYEIKDLYYAANSSAGYLPLTHSNNAFSASANISSANQEDNSVYYDITLLYKNTGKNESFLSDTLRLTENFLNVKGYVGATFDVHRVYIDMNIEHASYSGIQNFSAGIVEFSPIYRLQRRRLDARIGVKFGSRYGIGDAGEVEHVGQLAAKSNIFPDLDIRYELLKENLWAHAVIGGGNDLNPYSRIVAKCPLVMPDSELMFGTRALDASLALESVIGGRLGFNVSGSYVVGRDRLVIRPFEVWDYMARIRTDYMDINTLSAKAELFWQSQDLTMGGSATFNRHTSPEEKTVVTELPKFEADAYLRYSLKERFIAQADLRCTGATSGTAGYGDMTYEIPAAVALDINLNYLINKHFSVFAKCGNLLNNINFYVPYYAEPGRNFGGGLCISF